MSQSAVVPTAIDEAPPIDVRNLGWVALALVVLVAAIALNDLWLLNFIHVLAGVLWTGIDLFLGFVIGPILRGSQLAARRAIVIRLMPKTLFLLPTLATITGTAGWFHARQLGRRRRGEGMPTQRSSCDRVAAACNTVIKLDLISRDGEGPEPNVAAQRC
jgi:hypothetical protein